MNIIPNSSRGQRMVQLQANADAQRKDIYLEKGEQQQLPHKAVHVAQ